MAAMRSALTVLARRASGSLGGRALQIHPAAPRMLLQPYLRPAGRNNLESSLRFSTEGRNKADSVLNMLGQWSRDCATNVRKNADYGKSLVVCMCIIIVSMTSFSFTLTNSRRSRRAR